MDHPVPVPDRLEHPRALLRCLSGAPVAMALLLAACNNDPIFPPPDCSTDGNFYFIAVAPDPGPASSYSLTLGDSLKVTGTVMRATASAAIFDPQLGYVCRTTESVPVPATVQYASSDTAVLRVRPDGWMRAVGPGSAHLRVTSTAPQAASSVWVVIPRP